MLRLAHRQHRAALTRSRNRESFVEGSSLDRRLESLSSETRSPKARMVSMQTFEAKPIDIVESPAKHPKTSPMRKLFSKPKNK